MEPKYEHILKEFDLLNKKIKDIKKADMLG